MIALYIICYIASYFLAASGHAFLSGAALILSAAVIYIMEIKKTGNLLNIRGLFFLGFTGGEGVSLLKLSYLQKDWAFTTWAAFFAASTVFWVCFELTERFTGSKEKKKAEGSYIPRILRRYTDYDRLLVCIAVITAVSIAAFTIEACVLKYIPLFVVGVPHAYSEFHISGLHYFTVACVLVPALCVIWFMGAGDKTGIKKAVIICCALTGLIIPMLCVSRFNVIFAIALMIVTVIVLQKKMPWKMIGIAFCILIPALVLLTFSRSHDSTYLNSIFEMKVELPVTLSRIYIYIANNYDNFDCLVKAMAGDVTGALEGSGITACHTWGLKMLYPVIVFTGLKFKRPELVSFPLFVTKTELTTVTLFYDAYYDFGIPGVILLAAAVSIVCCCVEKIVRKDEDALGSIIYSQLALYMALSFFTTWFSNPTTWFWLGVSLITYMISTRSIKKDP